MVNIAIMSPSAERRDWLLHAIGEEPANRVVGAAATFPFLRSMIAEASADIAVIDLQRNVESGDIRDWVAEIADLVPIIVPGVLNLMAGVFLWDAAVGLLRRGSRRARHDAG